MGHIRITGGTHRSRKINVDDQPGLRPTSDRMREVLFNWLGHNLTGRKVLDLYAGSGILGFEAASRGAESITLVDLNRQVIRQLHNHVALLKLDNTRVVQAAAERFVNTETTSYDLIFLDPPFDSDEMNRISVIIEPLTQTGTLLYREYGNTQTIKPMNEAQWTQLKSKQTGQVIAELWQKQ
jgi:16S rRNA (guanine966-N2)-methyltransferase